MEKKSGENSSFHTFFSTLKVDKTLLNLILTSDSNY